MASKRAAGHTLIESMTVLALVGVALTLGLPAFADSLQRTRTRTTVHLLSSALAMARNSAVMRRSAVVVCPRDAGGGCNSTSDWSEGWIVFADRDGNRRPNLDADVLRNEDAPARGRSALRITSTRPFVRYQPDGRSANSNLTVHLCEGGRVTGQVIVNNLGRVRSSYQAAGTACPGP